jgi:hypothetical protein
MKKISALLVCLYLLLPGFANSQEPTTPTENLSLSGNAVSSAGKQPLTSVGIFINGQARGTTDLNGNFVLSSVQGGDVIRLKKEGYVSTSVIVGKTVEHLTFNFAPIWQLESATQVYLDIPAGAWYEAPIRKLYEEQVLSVKEPESFRPGENLTRAELAQMVVRAGGFLPENPAASHFCDIEKDVWYASSVEFMYQNKWLAGNQSDSCSLRRDFRPNAPVNRAEAVKMILAVFADLIPTETTNCTAPGFTDVATTDWFSPFVTTAYCQDLIKGYADNTFHPGEAINRAEIAAILANTLEKL